MQNATQKPLELILARNLMSALSTPAFLVDEGGILVFYNEAAGRLLGRRGRSWARSARRSGGRSSGRSTGGEPIPYDECRWWSRSATAVPPTPTQDPLADGTRNRVEVSAFPILTTTARGGDRRLLAAADTGNGTGG